MRLVIAEHCDPHAHHVARCGGSCRSHVDIRVQNSMLVVWHIGDNAYQVSKSWHGGNPFGRARAERPIGMAQCNVGRRCVRSHDASRIVSEGVEVYEGQYFVIYV